MTISRHRIWQVGVDAALVAAAWYLAFQLRFDRGVPVFYETLFERTILIVVGIKLVVFVLFGFYNHWWRYVSTRDMWKIVRGVTVASLVADLTVYLVSPVHDIRLPRSIAAMDWLLALGLVAGARLLVRTIVERPSATGIVARGKEVLVVGAGDAAQLIVREMLKSPALGYTPIGLVDDDPRKKNLRLHGADLSGQVEVARDQLVDARQGLDRNAGFPGGVDDLLPHLARGRGNRDQHLVRLRFP